MKRTSFPEEPCTKTENNSFFSRRLTKMKLLVLSIAVQFLLAFTDGERTDPCCHLGILDKCTVFQRSGRSLCTQETEADAGHDTCPRKIEQHETVVPSHVSLMDYTVQFTPCSPSTCEDEMGLSVTLNVSFTVDGTDIRGVLFHLEEAVHPGTNSSCHYVLLNDNETLTYSDIISKQDKVVFHFVGFDEDFHPGSSYKLWARPLPDHEDPDTHVQTKMVIRIPDCQSIEDEDRVHYCSLPSVAKWHSSVFLEVSGSSVNVSFTTNEDAPRIDFYIVRLERLPNERVNSTNIINNSTFWHWNETLGSNVLDHTFENLTPGRYNLSVHPRFFGTKTCDDPHWGVRNNCPEFCTIFVVEGSLAMTTPVPAPIMGTTAPPATMMGTTAAPAEWPLMPVIISAALAVGAVILVLVVVLCCCCCWRWNKRRKRRKLIGCDQMTEADSELHAQLPRLLQTGLTGGDDVFGLPPVREHGDYDYRELQRSPIIPREGNNDHELDCEMEGTLSIRGGWNSWIRDRGDQSGNPWDASTMSMISQTGDDWDNVVLRQDSGISVTSHDGENHLALLETTPQSMVVVARESVV